MSVVNSLQILDGSTCRHLTILLYSEIEKKNISFDWSMLHAAAKRLQGMLETKYGVTLGYRFNDPSIYGVWSNKFQLDIEHYEAVGLVITNPPKLSVTPEGYDLLQFPGRWILGKKFGNVDELTNNIRSTCVNVVKAK